MSNNILTEHFKEVADAIREKEGSSDLIEPTQFSSRIRNLQGGGMQYDD